jgi:GLE1-like protein
LEAQERDREAQESAIAAATEAEVAAVARSAAEERTKTHKAAAIALPPHVAEVARVWAQVSSEADAFRNDAAMKRPRLLLKKRVNLAANQIAASVKSVCTKIGDMVGTLGEASRSGIPAAMSFTMREIAERLVAEGAGSVALSRAAAFAVGAVVVGVVAQSPDPPTMRNVVLGAFYAKCAYIIPTYVRRHKGETDVSFRSRLNYLADESAEAYVERMCGYVSLYAAVVQTVVVLGPRGGVSGLKNPFAITDAWSWLARVINSPQRSITPDIVIAFLEIAGYEISRQYGSMFRKLVASLSEVCVHHAAQTARPGAKSRIAGFVDDYVKSGYRIEVVPTGKVLPASDAENIA